MMTLHLRCADTSVVLDLPDDRFPVVRHWGPDLGDVSGDDLSDAALAAETSLGTNTAWITNDLPILPLAHLGWNSRPAVALSRTDGSAFSPHPTAFTHEEDSEDTPAGTALVVRSSGTDTAHELTLGTELRLEACGLVRLRAWVRNDRPESDSEQGAGLVVGELTPVLPLPDSADELLDTTGHHVQERRLVRTPFTPGTRLRESWEGRPGHDAVTWLAAGPTGFGWRSGRVHGVHAAWSGNVRHLAMNPASGRKLLGAGELLLPGEVSLAPGQTYTSPWTVFSWGEGLDALAQRSHAWLRSRPSHPTRPPPPPPPPPGARAVENQRAPGSRQSLQEVPAGVGRADRLGDAAVNRASVETLLEAEHAGTGDLLTGDDRPLDRGGSAPGREQGEVEVQPSVLRNIQQVGRDQTPVGNHDGDVGIESSYPVRHLISSLALERGRSAHVETGLTSRGGHRRGMQ